MVPAKGRGRAEASGGGGKPAAEKAAQRNSGKGKEAANRPEKPAGGDDRFMKTGIDGFDKLMEKGIPKGSDVLIAGGAGSGKTIMCLQILANAA